MKRILLIEDEVLIQKSLKKLLELRGASVLVESSGKRAIEIIKTSFFDRIICDIMLQDVTGFEVIEESKKKYSLKEISQLFVIITAYSSSQIVNKAAKYGCKILSKPFDDLEVAMGIFLE